jgi:flagellar basal body P-ring protein FlgI
MVSEAVGVPVIAHGGAGAISDFAPAVAEGGASAVAAASMFVFSAKGEGVLISPCVVGLSDLTIAIVEEDQVSQPNPLAQGTTERVGRTRVEVQSGNTELKKVGGGGGATVSDLLQNLKTLGLTPTQLVSVFQALDQGGFLHATLEVR